MKRILLLIFILCGITAFAQKPIYVYFNDGTFKAFLSSQIDHISLAPANDNPESEMFLQEFWTADSVYRYPVHTIDSISSYTPPTQFKAEAIDLSGDMLAYVLRADTTHIFLQSDTPDYLIPQIGQKLGYPTIDELFPYGFAGEVKSVSRDAASIILDCNPVALDKVFDTLYLVITSEGSDESNSNKRAQRAPLKEGKIIKRHFDLAPISLSATAELSKNIRKSDDLAVNGSVKSSISISEAFDVTLFITVNNVMGYDAQISFSGTHDVESKLSAYGGIDYKHDFPFRNMREVFPLGYGFNFYILPGFFIDAAATISCSATATDHFKSAGCCEFSSRGQAVLKPAFSFKHVGTDSNAEMTLDGRFAFGAFIDAGFSYLDERLDHVAYRTEAGLELTGSAVLLKSDIERGKQDTGVYQKLKNSKISWNPYVSTGVTYGLAVWDETYTLTRSVYPPTWERDLVPTFSNAKLTPNAEQDTSVDASVEAHGNCIRPVPVSFVLFGKDDKEVGNYAFSKSYTNTPSLFQHTFNNLGIGKYSLYPQVSFLGFDLLASPSANAQLRVPIPEITSLYKVGSNHPEGGYNYGGQTYEYKFDLTVNAQVESLDGVDDWGFVYKDPTGQDVTMSLLSQGTSATYIFSIYTNQNTTTSTVHTFIIYSDDTIMRGEPFSFDLTYPKETEKVYHTCPDSNHPHIIDLGLPSGTLWSCCNVGASSPEEIGYYFAWGETVPKSSFDINTYKFWDNEIGMKKYRMYDIWYESYNEHEELIDNKTELDLEDDAAFKNWGTGWCMPTDEQWRELCFYRLRPSKADDMGAIIVGSNDSSIFLPASPDAYLCAGEPYAGFYWSRTLAPDFPYSDEAISMELGWSIMSVSAVARYKGEAVRPVRIYYR